MPEHRRFSLPVPPAARGQGVTHADHGAVLIADDHPLFRDALAQIIATTLPHAQVVECGTLEDAQAVLQAASPGNSGGDTGRQDFELILLDINMPGMNGMAGLLALRNMAPATPVVIVSGREDRETVDQAIGCGAAGFIPKSLSREGMSRALTAVLAGEISLPHEVPLDGGPDRPGERHAAVAALSSQQRRVLEMISAGKANKIIAYELAISESTVKAHVTAILRKLNLRSRIQAALYATRQG
jgi:DNA-binding NarL/FixJ family response regulator